jgi:hypothetical protein
MAPAIRVSSDWQRLDLPSLSLCEPEACAERVRRSLSAFRWFIEGPDDRILMDPDKFRASRSAFVRHVSNPPATASIHIRRARPEILSLLVCTSLPPSPRNL